jgi:hypothetical protein
MIDSFTYCGLTKVDIKNPDVEFVIFEDCGLDYLGPEVY